MDTTYFIPLLIIAIVVLSIGGVIVFLYNRRRKGLVSLNLKVLSIRIPRHEKSETKDFASEINLSEQLFTALSSINTEFVFEISVKSVGEEICFYLAVPREALDFAKRTVQGLFLEAKVEEAPDYTIFQPQGASTAGYLALAKPYLLPITTYRESEADVFSPIISTLSRLDNLEEGATLQFIVRPTGEHFKKDAMEILSRLKKGEKFKDLTDKSLVSFDKIEKAILTQPKKDEADNTPKVLDEEMIKSVGMKLAKPLFSINVRIITASTNHNKAEDSFLSISSSFSKFASPTRNSFKIVKPKNHKKLIFNYIFREFDESQKMILNAEELASIFHLPTTTSDVPNISWLRSKEAPAPEFLPTTGLFLGESIFRDNKKEIRLTDDDRRRHMYLVGQTGTGKSVLLQNMAMQDMINGKGLCVIDPHGELIEKLLAFVPKERIDDVIVLDPGDMERPLGLNMLEFDETKPEEKTFIINELQAIFNQLFQKETMGPMFEKYMRNSLLLLMEDAKNEPATITEIARIFSDEDFRKRKLARCNNTSVIDFWTKEVPKVTGEAGLGNMAPYITSKFDNFISNDYIRPMIGQVKSAFNFR
ncbi:MAG: type IV secretion system DNA-binding domain-containing protein, partial [Candidatus Vogelbacteria bacterium]|nr:type IV secretion system DNA-binding domain-containing protein [Candidatus Vogelbacteria bacterium]